MLAPRGRKKKKQALISKGENCTGVRAPECSLQVVTAAGKGKEQGAESFGRGAHGATLRIRIRDRKTVSEKPLRIGEKVKGSAARRLKDALRKRISFPRGTESESALLKICCMR